MRKLIIRVDSTPTIGMGHAFRTAALVECLRDAFSPVICGQDEKLVQAFPNIPRMDLAEALADKQSLVLIDHPSGLNAVPVISHPKILIDDFGGVHGGDLILNGTITANPNLYPEIQDSHRLLLGPDYALLRMAFGEAADIERRLEAHDDPHEAPEKISIIDRIRTYFQPVQRPTLASYRLQGPKKKYDLLLIAGSGLAAKKWVADMIELFSQWNLAIVVGAHFDLSFNTGSLPIYQNLSAEPLAALMRQSKMALVTGGMVLYECLAAGIPTMAYPSEQNMLPEITRLEDLGIIDNIGNIKNKPQHLRSIIMNKDYLQIRAEKGTKLVDGLGAKRAADIIKNRFA